MHKSSYIKMQQFKEKYLLNAMEQQLIILDFGSLDVNGSYRQVFSEPIWKYYGMDMSDGPNVDIVLKKPYIWKEVKSRSIDVFISGQAFEHVEFFWLTLLEMIRVMKDNGICCILAPSGGPEHRYPVDCYRFYTDGMKAMARFVDLDVVEAYTDTNPEIFGDHSEDWKDSCLIARKNPESLLKRMHRHFLQYLLYRWTRTVST